VRIAWEQQGLPPDSDLISLFEYDAREEVEYDLDPRPQPGGWPTTRDDLKAFRKRFKPSEARMPKEWRQRVDVWRQRSEPLILRVQRGFFLSLGVEGWNSFHKTIALTKDEPKLLAELLRLQGELSAVLAEQVLDEVSIDAALFSEPIGGEHGPLISPAMYAELVLPSYLPILTLLQRRKVEVIIVRTYANPRPLLPLFVQAGINCLWAVEAPPNAMDYLQIRREFGKDLRLIGGIDTDALRAGRVAVQQEIERVAPLAEEGGYIPLLDGRVRDEVRYADYCHYRRLLESITAF
jgi:hypothetical protein